MTNLIGQSLGRYHILEQLGEGGMATVYKAYDTRLESNVAIKLIRIEKITPETLARSLKRFEREAKALAKLTHPNIIKVIDYGEFKGRPYLVMPYLPGKTLKDLLNGKPIKYDEAAKLLLPIAQALGYAHREGIIHRDVKPSNILLTAFGAPMLSDFGVAKMVEDEATLELTGTNASVGTPEYMAPEQVTSKTVDHRADIYALGIVFYEMITGRKPFKAETPMAVLFKQASDPLPAPRQFNPAIPEFVEPVLYKALAKMPENRFENMAVFSAALEKLALKISPGIKTANPTRLYTIMGVLSIFLVIAGGYYFLQNKQSQTRKATPIPPPATSTELIISTKSTDPSAKAQIGYYDDFENPAFEGAFDPSKWSIDAGSSGSALAFQHDGVLIVSDTMPTTGQGIILGLPEWTRSTFIFFEAKIKIDNISGENGNITMNVTSPSIPVGYKEYGLAAYSDVTRVFLAGDNGNNIIEKDIKRNIWHTLKIVFNRDENTLLYYFDGKQFSTYKIPKKVSVLTPSIQLWHENRSYFSGALDEVKVGY